MNKEDLIKALEEIRNNYRLVSLRDCVDLNKILGMVYLNNKHSIQDFQNAIYNAKTKRAKDIYTYGDDWTYISEELDKNFDYFNACDYENINDEYVEY